jgi:hypothetical protein
MAKRKPAESNENIETTETNETAAGEASDAAVPQSSEPAGGGAGKGFEGPMTMLGRIERLEAAVFPDEN